MPILTSHDKYFMLQAENARLKRQLGKAFEAIYISGKRKLSTFNQSGIITGSMPRRRRGYDL